MDWRFWKKEKNSAELDAIEKMRGELVDVRGELSEVHGQMAKLMRLQYKTGKKTEEKIDGLKIAMDVQHEERIEGYKQQQKNFIEDYISLLDEFDRVASGLTEDQLMWHQLFRQWSGRIILRLREAGIREMDVLDKPFDAKVSEGVKTVPLAALEKEGAFPYQVITVLKRGFIDADERLIRKAQVITVEGDINGKPENQNG
jgi:molecular chaperone GrpE (heat shock protein)